MVARRRGWGGDPPETDDEARRRIIEAATELLTQRSCALLLSDVADSLNVARQTVYKYFPSADALVTAAALVLVDEVIDTVARRTDPSDGPGTAVVDAVVAAVEIVNDSAVLRHAFRHSEHLHLATGVVSRMTRGQVVITLRQTGIDWTGLGYSPGDLDDIADLALRMLQSQLLSPDDSGDPGELRAKLLRWIRPAIDAGVTQASTD
ncbi:MAG: TetR/AcrR family transcriptional regulator [Williamsia herbipolensis]|nr:TetR/AcrR family transcriptional regulator [Williamsia herbipolensis]